MTEPEPIDVIATSTPTTNPIATGFQRGSPFARESPFPRDSASTADLPAVAPALVVSRRRRTYVTIIAMHAHRIAMPMACRTTCCSVAAGMRARSSANAARPARDPGTPPAASSIVRRRSTVFCRAWTNAASSFVGTL